MTSIMSNDDSTGSPTIASVSEMFAGWNPLNNPHPDETPAEKLHREAHESDERYKAAVIKLDQINSRIHKTVFRVDEDILNGTPDQRIKLNHKMATIKEDLDRWIQTYPQTPKSGNKITWMYDPESAYLDARDFYGV